MAEILNLEEKRLEKLPPRELAGHLMMLPAKRRLDLILQHADARSVVAAIGMHDFYFSVLEIGPDDSLPFLALADTGQLNHLFDIEWWQKDSLQASNAISWFDRLQRASEENLLAWLYKADFELLVALFKKWIRVLITPEDVDPLEAREQLPKNTLDDVYFWEPVYPQYEELLTRVLSLLFEIHQGFYRELMNHVIWVTDNAMEEEAYHFHRARLEENGIPDFYDALEIYRSIAPGEIASGKKAVDIMPEESAPPSFALALVPEGEVLSVALAAIEDRALAYSLQLELALLANKAVVADQVSTESPAALRNAVAKTAAYVNLGLELLSGGDRETAVKALEDVYLEHLFRLAQTRVGEIRNRLGEIVRRGWLSEWPEGIRCLDREWMEQAELLLGKTPMLLRPASVPGSAPGEDYFRKESDFRLADRFIRTVALLAVPYRALNPHPDMIGNSLLPGSQIPGLADVTLGAMILTAAAQFLMTKHRALQPIPVSQWPVLFPLAQPEPLREAVGDWVLKLLPHEREHSLVFDYVDSILKAYSEEMPAFSGTSLPDPHMVGFFLFTEG